MDKSKSSAARALLIAQLEERFRHELMDDEERLELRERIIRLKKQVYGTGARRS